MLVTYKLLSSNKAIHMEEVVSDNTHQILSNKNIEPMELANLMASVGWGLETAYKK
jgi:hypothetical protein